MGIMEMMNDMPLISVLMFFPGAMQKAPDEMVDELLLQVHSQDK
jgi:hypothetical protein